MSVSNMADNGSMMKRILEKHGPFAAMLVATCVALYLCVVVPFQSQQELLTNSNRILLDNTVKQSEELTDAYKALSESFLKGEETRAQQVKLLEEINEAGETRNKQLMTGLETNKALLEALKGFSDGVKDQHDGQSDKLDTIIEYTKPKT